jgi:hypothetical protein
MDGIDWKEVTIHILRVLQDNQDIGDMNDLDEVFQGHLGAKLRSWWDSYKTNGKTKMPSFDDDDLEPRTQKEVVPVPGFAVDTGRECITHEQLLVFVMDRMQYDFDNDEPTYRDDLFKGETGALLQTWWNHVRNVRDEETVRLKELANKIIEAMPAEHILALKIAGIDIIAIRAQTLPKKKPRRTHF